MTRHGLIFGCALSMTGCTDRLATSDGDDTTGQATSTGEPSTGTSSTSSTLPTTGEPTTTTGEPDTTSGTTTPIDTTGPVDTTDTTTGTTEPDTTTGTTGETDTETEFPAPACPSACERTTVHMGDLKLFKGDSTAELVCVTEVTGNIIISGAVDEAALAGLSGLEKVGGGLFIDGDAALTGLAPFSCLREVDELWLNNTPALVDLAPLSGLTALSSVGLFGTGVIALPELTAPQLGLQKIQMIDNAALQDLDAMTTWTASSEALSVDIRDMPALTSIAGLAGPLADSAKGAQSVYLENLAQLGSLAGLEPLEFPNWLYLIDLPKVADLGPLAKLDSSLFFQMSGMPLVKSLTGLGQATHFEHFVLGGCVNGSPDSGGMDGLTSLAGLAKLMSVGTLAIGNSDKLTALTGAPALQAIEDLHLVGNTQLVDADVAALVAQLGQPPDTSCFGDWGECQCIVIEPP